MAMQHVIDIYLMGLAELAQQGIVAHAAHQLELQASLFCEAGKLCWLDEFLVIMSAFRNHV